MQDKAGLSQERFSLTAGVEQRPLMKRTWTVGDTDDGMTHRGGQQHAKTRSKKGNKPPREWGTGVNAIPVG
jgi:nucleolar protein 6